MSNRNRVATRLLAAATVLVAAMSVTAAERADHDITLPAVALRPGVEADVHLRVFVNGAAPCEGKVMLAVSGVAHTAASWGPFAHALFADNPTGRKACQVAALDFPGHGESSLPRGVLFGDLTLADYVSVVRGVLERLPEVGVRPSAIVAHSQGGLVVQMTQQSLLAGGTSLRRRHKIKQVVLLSSVGPAEVPWDFVANGTAAVLVGAFVTGDAVRGVHVAIPDVVWPSVFFSDLSGTVAPGAPGPATVAAFNAPAPLLATLELVGFPPFSRPHVDAGAFGPGTGTTLRVVAYEQDTIIRPGENALLYEHLTGDGSGAGFVEVSGAATVHDLHVADPRRLLDELGAAGTVELP